MEVNLVNIHSPCVMCEIHAGISWNPASDHCQRCDYNIAVFLLRNILRIPENVGIDWESLFKEYHVGIKD